jgi:hypothetical protein
VAEESGSFGSGSGAAAGGEAKPASLADTDRRRFGYSYEAEAGRADAASRAVDAAQRRSAEAVAAGDGWAAPLGAADSAAAASAELYASERAVSASTEALQGVVRLLIGADAATEGDVFSANVASRVLASALANARSGSASTAPAGGSAHALMASESLPASLGSACLRLLRWSKTLLTGPGAMVAAATSPHGQLVGAALSAVSEAVRSPSVRTLFQAEAGVGVLLPYASVAAADRSYTAVRALWTLSLSAPCRAELDTQDAIHALCALVSPQTRKPKVVRMAVAVLASIARDDASARDGVPLMAETHLAASLRLLLSRSEDVDARSDAASLLEALSSNHRVLTSLERYDRELAAHRLVWSPVHNSPFWRENYAEFEAAGCRRLKILRALMRAAIREMLAAATKEAGAGSGAATKGAGAGSGAATKGAGAGSGAAGTGAGGSDADAKASDAAAGTASAAAARSPLVELELSLAPSTTTVAVACADVGEFAAAHPNGKL